MVMVLLFCMKYYFEEVVEVFERRPTPRWRVNNRRSDTGYGYSPPLRKVNPVNPVVPNGTPSCFLLAPVRGVCGVGAVADPFSSELFNVDDLACSHRFLFRRREGIRKKR